MQVQHSTVMASDGQQRFTPCLWYDDQAEEAAKFYVSIFKNSKVGRIARYGESAAKVSGRPAGSVMTVEFELDGQKFLGLNGGPTFKFTEAISFMVSCDSQEELDRIWDRLAAGGQILECGWLKDRYGLAWQVVPAVLPELMRSPKADKVMDALLHMKKLDIRGLEQAAR